MKTILKWYTILSMLVMSILLAGCSVRDDMDDCGSFRLWVRFDSETFDLPEGEHRIESIDVYAFDEQGLFVSQWEEGPYDYRSGTLYEIPVELMPGTYTFVAWTNAHAGYKIKPEVLKNSTSALRDFELYLEGSAGNRFEADIPDLHYGRIEGAVNDPTRDTEYTIYLIPDTYRINLRVEGLEEYGENFSVLMADNNGHYDFLNRVLEQYGVYYHERKCKMEDLVLQASIRTLSLTDDHAIGNIGQPGTADRSPVLQIINRTNDTELFSDNMVKIIRRAYSESGKTVDFDKTYRFDIDLSFDANMDVTISVNGWSYRHNPIEL